MVNPFVFADLFGGLLISAVAQKNGGSDDGIARDTADVAARTADAAAKRVADAASEIQVLRTAIERLVLVNQALWEIIAETQGLTDEQLLSKVKEIDLRDGVLDGKMRKPLRNCVSCGKVLQQGREKCIYCGTRKEGASPLDSIDLDARDLRGQGLV